MLSSVCIITPLSVCTYNNAEISTLHMPNLTAYFLYKKCYIFEFSTNCIAVNFKIYVITM